MTLMFGCTLNHVSPSTFKFQVFFEHGNDISSYTLKGGILRGTLARDTEYTK